MSKLLVYKTNYADEFDITASTIENNWDLGALLIGMLDEDLDYEFELYFGTNECVYTTLREFINSVKVYNLETEHDEELVRPLLAFGDIFDQAFEILSDCGYGCDHEK